MLDTINAFVTPTYLRSVWNSEYEVFKDTPAEAELLGRLRRWAGRANLGETGAEAAFIEEFFRTTWGYVHTGQVIKPGDNYTLRPQFPIPGSGAGGGTGRADVALGYFAGVTGVPQVLCEFKGIKSSLDAD